MHYQPTSSRTFVIAFVSALGLAACALSLVACALSLVACATKGPESPDDSDPSSESDDGTIGRAPGGSVDWACVDQCAKSGSGSKSTYCYASCSF